MKPKVHGKTKEKPFRGSIVFTVLVISYSTLCLFGRRLLYYITHSYNHPFFLCVD